jgi:hypothetical protein
VLVRGLVDVRGVAVNRSMEQHDRQTLKPSALTASPVSTCHRLDRRGAVAIFSR